VERVEAAVIGAGVMGSATALALARRGVETVLLERFEVGHARGSSHGPTRIFRCVYPEPDYVRLAQRALPVWRRLEDDAGEPLLLPAGCVVLGPEAERCADALATCGAAFGWLTPAEAGSRFPGIAFDDADRVLLQPEAGVCLADRTVAAQVRLARDRGADVRERVEATAVHPSERGAVIGTTAGELEAAVVVVTAGSWAPGMLGPVIEGTKAARPDLRPTVQTVAYFEPTEPAMAQTMPTFIDWTGDSIAGYAVPSSGIAPGVKLGDHTAGQPVGPDDGPFEPDPARLEALRAFARKRFPGLDPEPVAVETCLYTLTPDEDFVLDRVGPIVIGAGFSGHGFKFGPLIGELLADLATGADPKLPERFSIRRAALSPG
jgi:sarcosine oxidase